MSTNWNLYLSRYQQARGGHFFGALEDDYDCHLILTEGESSPILVWIDTDPGDGCYEHNILARTMIKLDQTRELNISPRSLVGGGLMSVAGLVRGGLDFDKTEATRGRIITGSDKSFSRQVLAEPGVQQGLSTWKKVCLQIRPAPRKEEGWHVVQLTDVNFEGSPVNGSHWVCDAMEQDLSRLSPAEQERLLQAGSEHFNARMDTFLDVLRAACQAAADR